jgi:hypothetical protein
VFAMATTLGWPAPYRNVDLRLDEDSKRASGIDQLLSIQNPRTDQLDGWLLEGKLHDSAARYVPSAHKELEEAREKVVKLRKSIHRFDENWNRQVEKIVGAVVVHGTSDYDPDKAALWLGEVPFEHGTENSLEPTRLAFLATDTLNGLAEAFGHRDYGRPVKFYWPPVGRADGRWERECPIEQLSAGMVAYELADGRRLLWLRGMMEPEDVSAIPEVAWRWNCSFAGVLYTELNPKGYRSGLQQAWKANGKAGGRAARVPDDITPLGVNNATLNSFDREWPSTAH